jgi:hypothetical protein
MDIELLIFLRREECDAGECAGSCRKEVYAIHTI